MTAAQQAAFRLACTLPARTVVAKPRPQVETAFYQQRRVHRLWKKGMKVRDIASVTGYPRSTVGRWVKGVPR